MNIETLEYTITHFDTANKVVHVDFGPDGHAVIPLVEPLPTDKGELDKIVRTFAAPVEALKARTSPSHSLGFIHALVNKPQQAARFSFEKAHNPAQVVTPPTSVQEVLVRKLDAISAWRYAREVAGIQVGHLVIKTDRESQAALAAAHTALSLGAVSTVAWKGGTGNFAVLDLPEAEALSVAVAQHVQACFAAELELVRQLEQALAGVTDLEQAIAAAETVVLV